MFLLDKAGGSPEFMPPDPQPGSLVHTLRPGARCGFTFNGLSSAEEDHIMVAWFTDDAGFRWQLDDYLHLVQAADGDKYEP
jgi:hypothetical protein